MSRFFIHVRDRDAFFADTEGVEAANQHLIRPFVEQTVREIVRDGGGWTAGDRRAVEVTDETGATILDIPFRAIMVLH